MSDDIVAPTSTAAPAVSSAALAAAPAEVSPVPSAASPQPDAAPASGAPAESTTAPETTFLGAADPDAPADADATKPEEPAGDAKPDAQDAKPDENNADADKPAEPKEGDSQTDEPAPLPSYEPFTLPEDIAPDTERLESFTKLLAELEASKPDHTGFQKFGQSLVDAHVSGVKEALERQSEALVKTWEKQKSDWKEAFVNDPEIGGKRQETTQKSVMEFVKRFGGTKEQVAEFRALMNETGVGNSPALIRVIANAMRDKAEGRPLPATKPVQASRSKVQTRYGNNS